jgi:hypothetical protein
MAQHLQVENAHISKQINKNHVHLERDKLV